MNNFKYYVISWAVLLAAFNAIVFVCAKGNFSSAFWIGYAFISVAFIGQLICAAIAFKPSNITKKFYNIPIVTESYAGLILMLIFGGLFMAVPVLPKWPGIVICMAILILTFITVMQASANAEMVEAIDIKVTEETAFIKNLTKEAELLVTQAKSEEIKADCVKVYEAFRYAPKRSKYTPEVEKEIREKFEELRNFVLDANIYEVQKSKELLIALINGY